MANKRSDDQHRSASEEERQLARLINLGGQRAPIDGARRERVRRAVYQSWRDRHEAAAPGVAGVWLRRYPWMVGLAAGVALFAAAAVLWSATSGPGSSAMGRAEVVRGPVYYRGEPLTPGLELEVGGTLIARRAGGLVVALDGGGVLKLDENSQLTLRGRAEVTLQQGALYFDSQDRGSLTVHTPRGSASDIGTQFETRLSDETLIIRVRQGAVALTDGADNVLLRSGQMLEKTPAGGTAISPLPERGTHWWWVDALEEAFDFDGRSVAAILHWLASREGWQVHYRNAQDRAEAGRDIIRGQLAARSGEAILEQLAIISAMNYHLEGSAVEIYYP